MSAADAVGRRALARARRVLIPFLFLLYVVSYLDRVNVGFAALQMNAALGLSPAAYGLGAGIFFFGYVLLEVPSNLMLARVGARLWIARIMIVWGLASAAMLLVRGEKSFYALRFLLGAAEAGFFPGIILYLTYWFPAAERARAVAQFMTATAVAGVVGGPLSGALLGLDGRLGLQGWQWLFLGEALPALLLGVVVLIFLPDRPERARFLKDDEREWLVATLRREAEQRDARQRSTLAEAFQDVTVWRLSALYFCLVVGLYGISFWLPQMLKGLSGASDFAVAVISAVPYLAAALAMVRVAAHSDASGERRWHVAGPAFLAAAGFVLAGLARGPLTGIAALSLAALGVWSALGPFWTLPTAMLRGTAAAGGIALVNSVGNLGGFLGPSLVGWVRQTTGGFGGGLLLLAGALLAAGLLALATPAARRAAAPSVE
jgi:MFS transporter, ACS family, tartrate transporter